MDEPGEPRLLDRVHDTIRRKHYSIRTEQAYVDWIKRFILFHDKRLPAKLGATEVEEFHTHLAVDREVAQCCNMIDTDSPANSGCACKKRSNRQNQRACV